MRQHLSCLQKGGRNAQTKFAIEVKYDPRRAAIIVQSSHQNFAPDRCLAHTRMRTPTVANIVNVVVKPKTRGWRFGIEPSCSLMLAEL